MRMRLRQKGESNDKIPITTWDSIRKRTREARGREFFVQKTREKDLRTSGLPVQLSSSPATAHQLLSPSTRTGTRALVVRIFRADHLKGPIDDGRSSSETDRLRLSLSDHPL